MRKPPWVLPAARDPAAGDAVRRLMRELGLATVCESARCPNLGECLGAGTATFLVLGGACTRRCGFCAVAKGPPAAPDPGEPTAVAAAVRRLGLAHAVVTSVTRDDLPDGGAAHFAATVRAIRAAAPGAHVELLVPDFAGAPGALETVLAAGPDVLAHNLETVPRLYPRVRPGADYGRSLALLRRAREAAPGVATKSGLMAGLGERVEEMAAVLRDLAAAGVAALTVGQYLQPGRGNLPVERYLAPAEFGALAAAARAAGIARVAAGPLVRSSYRARELHAG
jgi:lipoic acid synthetase